MRRYQPLQNKPRTLRALTSLEPAEFEAEALLPSFEAAWQAYVQEHWVQGQERQRRYGAGRRPQLHRGEDKLLFILVYLVYFKLYPLQEALGRLFGLSQAQANEWIHRLTPVLQQALGYEKQLPERKPHHLEQVLSACPSLEFFLDGTERGIPRPQDAERQKLNYSGKKKTHTRKNLVITDAQRRMQYLSGTCEGKKHDKAVAESENYTFPEHSTLYQDTGFQDTGFQGYQPATTVQTLQPKKKPVAVS